MNEYLIALSFFFILVMNFGILIFKKELKDAEKSLNDLKNLYAKKGA